MAPSSQTTKYQDRLAVRQRGAGTRKVLDTGIEFDLDLSALALPLPTALPSPPRQPANSGTAASRPPDERQPPESAPPQALDQERGSPFGSLVAEPPTRRTSPRTNASQSTVPDPGRDPSSKRRVDVARISPHAVPPAAVASVTPEPRGKRLRQPSPDKFLDTPDRREMQQSRQNRLGNGVKGKLAENLAARRRGAGIREVANPGFVFEGLDELVEQTRKRRKFSLQPEPEQVPELTRPAPVEATGQVLPVDEMGVEPLPASEPEDESFVNGVEPLATGEGDQTREEDDVRVVTRKSPRVNKEAGQGEDATQTPTQKPARRKPRGKRPPPPKVTAEEEREAVEAERAALLQAEAAVRAEREAQARKEAMLKRKEQARAEALLAEEAEKRAREAAKSKAKGKGRAATTARPPPEPETESELGAEETDEGPRVIAGADKETRPAQPKKKRGPQTHGGGDEVAKDGATQGRKRGVPITILRYPKGDRAPPPPPGGNRKGVNHIDMISKLFMEVIDREYSQLQGTRERKAIENYKEEVAARLRTYTEAVEGYISIQNRTRQARKRQHQLQQELLEVDRQRRAVAVKMDEVRHNHEAASKKTERRQRAGSAFEDIAGIVELAEAGSQTMPAYDPPPPEGLEALLAMVVPVVTGGDEDGSGMLSQVVGFNRLLERTTKVLKEYNMTNANTT